MNERTLIFQVKSEIVYERGGEVNRSQEDLGSLTE